MVLNGSNLVSFASIAGNASAEMGIICVAVINWVEEGDKVRTFQSEDPARWGKPWEMFSEAAKTHKLSLPVLARMN